MFLIVTVMLSPETLHAQRTAPLTFFAAPADNHILIVPLNFEYQSYKLSTAIRFDTQTGNAWYFAAVSDQNPTSQWVYITGITSATPFAKLAPVSFEYQSQKLSTVIWFDTQTGSAWYFGVVPSEKPSWHWLAIRN